MSPPSQHERRARRSLRGQQSMSSIARTGPDVAPQQDARIVELRRLVAKDGLTTHDAAQRLGVDPIIAHLWLRLPDDLFVRCDEPPPIPPLRVRRERSVPATPAAQPDAGQRPPRYVTVVGPNGVKRIARSDGAPLAMVAPPPSPLRRLHRARHELAPLSFTRFGLTAHAIAAKTAIRPHMPTGATRVVGVTPEQRSQGIDLKRRRLMLELSGRELAAASGISRGMVAAIEDGSRGGVWARFLVDKTLSRLEGLR